MRTYIRKMMKHDITHEVSLTAYVFYDFFAGNDSVLFQIDNQGPCYVVTFNNATDLRFGGDFKTICRFLDAKEGDFLLITRSSDDMYSITLEKGYIAAKSSYAPFFTGTRRHLIATFINGHVSKQYVR